MHREVEQGTYQVNTMMMELVDLDEVGDVDAG